MKSINSKTVKSLIILLFFTVALIAQNNDKEDEDFDWEREPYIFNIDATESIVIEGCENAMDKNSCFLAKIDKTINEYNFKCSDCKGEVKIYLNIMINRYGTLKFGGFRTSNEMFRSQYSKNNKERKKFERYLKENIKVIKSAQTEMAKSRNISNSIAVYRKIILEF